MEFIPDPEIFNGYTFRDEFIERRLQHYAFLNSGLKIQYNDKAYQSENGLKDLLEHEAGEEAIYPVFYYREKHWSSPLPIHQPTASGTYPSPTGSTQAPGAPISQPSKREY